MLILLGFSVGGLFFLIWSSMFHIAAASIAAGTFYRGSDFATMWQAGAALQGGHAAILYNPPDFDRWLMQRQGGTLPTANWLYPPPMGLLALAVKALPLKYGFWVWRLLTTAMAVALLRVGKLSYPVIFAGVFGVVEIQDILLGQNGELTGGLLVASLLLVETRPRLAGCLAGILCIKPQIGILLPAVMLQRRYLVAFGSAVMTVAVLATASALVEGWQSWFWFVTIAQPFAGRILATPFGQIFQMDGFTVFLAARSFGLALRQSWMIQAIASVCSMAATWWLWRREGVDPIARMVLTVSLSMLAMPYGFSYDLVSFSIALAALAWRAPYWQLPLIAPLWLWPGLTIFLTKHFGVIFMPMAALAAIALALPRLNRNGASNVAAGESHCGSGGTDGIKIRRLGIGLERGFWVRTE